MSPREFARWQAYDRLEPFGHWRDNWHFAVLIHEISRAFGNDPPSVMPWMWEIPAPAEVREQQKAEARRIKDQNMIEWFDKRSAD